ncbi:PEP/pyruvate-binding domain-containing protein [Actinophytocola sediminis]
MAGMIRLGDRRLTEPTQVGHKFARQERLRRAGFAVPEFFCVPVTEFDALAAEHLATAPALDEEDDLLRWAEHASAALAGTRLPAALTEEIRAALPQDGGLLAVRACVVSDEDGVGEDGETDAFAGLTDSFLYVRPRDVPRRVVECWASGLSPRSIRYRAHRGLAPATARVAVGVQRMVLGTRSFVAFSQDPRGGTQRVIAAAHGIGEGVVQERADIDHFFVDPDSGAVRVETVHKERLVTLDQETGQLATVPVPADLATPPVLDEQQVRQVAELAAEVAKWFGAPQDIEGTITPDGRVHLLQARPVVFAENRAGERIPWSNNNVTESFAGVSGALTFSQARTFYHSIFRDAYRRVGVPARRLDAAENHLHRMIGLLDGRVYYRLDAWWALHSQIPGFPLVQVWWARSMGLSAQRRPTRRQLTRALLGVPGLAVRAAAHPRAVRRFLRWWDTLFARTPDMTDWTPEQLVQFYRRLWAEVGRWWGVTLTNGFFLLATATAATAAIRRWVGEDDEGILSRLLLGGRENRSILAVRSMITLAEHVAANQELAQRVHTGPADEVWAELAGGRFGDGLADMAITHLRRYGDRAPHDLKLEEPSPRQRPGMIVDTLRSILHSGLTAEENRSRELAGRAAAEQELRTRCPNLPRRQAIRLLAATMRWLVRNREDTRYCRSQLFGLSRQVLWRLGDHLVAAGVLDDRADVVDLTVEEVLGAYDGTLIDTDLRALAAARRRARLAAAERPDLDAELTTTVDRPVVAELPSAATAPMAGNGVELRGLPSSGGVVRYPARIVLEPSISPESCRDHIIVAKETDPGWLFLMMAARGLVVERGTLLSHTAITGRLLGVPTVVSVPGATSLIEDGMMIELDGTAGTVRMVAAEQG